MGGRWSRVFALATVSACGADRDPLAAISAALSEDLDLLALSVSRGDAVVAATGLVDRAGAKALELEVDLEEDDELVVYGYRSETLAGVGAPAASVLSAHPLSVADSGPVLPPSDQELHGSVVGGRAALEVRPPLGRVTAGWCTPIDPCSYWGFQATEFPLGLTGLQFEVMVKWSERQVLALSQEGELRRIDVDGSEVAQIVPLEAALRPIDLFTRGPEDVYGVGLAGQFVHVGPGVDAQAEGASLPLTGLRNLKLHGAPASQPLELFALADGRSLLRYHEGTWSVVFEAEGAAVDVGPVRWLGPDRAAAGLEGTREVVIYDHGVAARIELPGNAPPKALEYVEPYGLLVGTHQGRIYEIVDGRAELLFEVPGSLERVRFIGGFEDGLVFLHGSNFVGAHHVDYGWCLPRPMGGSDNTYYHVLDLGDVVVTAAQTGDPFPAAVVRLDRGKKPSPRCLAF